MTIPQDKETQHLEGTVLLHVKPLAKFSELELLCVPVAASKDNLKG